MALLSARLQKFGGKTRKLTRGFGDRARPLSSWLSG